MKMNDTLICAQINKDLCGPWVIAGFDKCFGLFCTHFLFDPILLANYSFNVTLERALEK